jgi:hypothetical protein
VVEDDLRRVGPQTHQCSFRPIPDRSTGGIRVDTAGY